MRGCESCAISKSKDFQIIFLTFHCDLFVLRGPVGKNDSHMWLYDINLKLRMTIYIRYSSSTLLDLSQLFNFDGNIVFGDSGNCVQARQRFPPKNIKVAGSAQISISQAIYYLFC